MPRAQFRVSLNGDRTESICIASLKSAKEWIKAHVLSTHMGQWRRIDGGYEYSTTIGRYYTFKSERIT